MPLRQLLLQVIVFVAIAFIATGCWEKKDPSSGHVPVSENTEAVVQLQRVFDYVNANTTILMLQSPQDNDHWYIVEKAGRVLRVSSDPGNTGVDVYLDINERVDSSPNEAGLLGMAFHPQFAQNGQVFLSYTAEGSSLSSVISRFSRSADGNSLLPESEQILLRVGQPYSNHNGGHIAFGPDGFLYIGFGDGGSGGDPEGNGQNIQTLLGSMLRIDVDNGTPYSIPASNPFASNQQGLPEIFAWGLRNPWRWSFDKENGDLWVADVGQNSWEEVNVMRGPGNYGWSGKEGTHCYESSLCDNPEFIDPVVEYSHDDGCSVTGGYVYRGNEIALLSGTYLYSDFCSGTLWGAKSDGAGNYQVSRILQSGFNVASFAEGNNGEIYLINIEGEFYKLVSR